MPLGTGVKTSLLVLKKTSWTKNIFFSKIKNIDSNIRNSTDTAYYLNHKTKKTSLDYKQTDIEHTINIFHNKNQKNQLNHTTIDLEKEASTININTTAWWLKSELLKDRWDAEHYFLKDLQMIKKYKIK